MISCICFPAACYGFNSTISAQVHQPCLAPQSLPLPALPCTISPALPCPASLPAYPAPALHRLPCPALSCPTLLMCDKTVHIVLCVGSSKRLSRGLRLRCGDSQHSVCSRGGAAVCVWPPQPVQRRRQPLRVPGEHPLPVQPGSARPHPHPQPPLQ